MGKLKLKNKTKKAKPIYDPLLYGNDPEENIVAVEPIPDEPQVEVFIRENGRLRSRIDHCKAFFYTNKDEPLLDDLWDDQTQIWALEGDLHYDTMVETNNIRASWWFKKNCQKGNWWAVRERGQYLLSTGKTLFKGMDFDDPVRLYFDIETYTTPGYKFTNPERPNDRVLIISVATNRGHKIALVLDEDDWAEDKADGIRKENPDTDYVFLKTEEELIEAFIYIVQDIDPDVLCNHNIFNFDLWFLHQRCRLLDIKFALGRGDKLPNTYDTVVAIGDKNREIKNFEFYGRHILDTDVMARQVDVVKRKFENYQLKYLVREIGEEREGRIIVPGGRIADAWDNNDPEYNRKDLISYAVDDALDAQKLDRAFGKGTFYATQFTPYPYQDVMRLATGGKSNTLFVRHYYHHNHSLPSPPKRQSFGGGYNFRDLFGLIIEPINLADVKSLYPSLGIELNIQPKNDVLGYYQQVIKLFRELRYSFKDQIEETDDPKVIEEMKAIDTSIKPYLNTIAYGYLTTPFSLFGDYSEGARITEAGQKKLKKMHKFMVDNGATTIRGDSVTEDTPVFIKDDKGNIDIISIGELHNNIGVAQSDPYRNYLGYENLKVLTRRGWSKINYTKKHSTDKTIYRILTRSGLAKVTEDHSLFSNTKEVKPSELNVGDNIDERLFENFGHSNQDITPDQAWLLGFMVSDGSTSRVPRKNGSYSTNISIHKTDLTKLKKAKKILKSWGIKTEIYNTIESSGCNRLTGGYNKKDYEFITNLIYDKYTGEKKVPKIILNSSDHIVKEFFKGQMDGDGYQDPTRNQKSITTKSYILASGLIYLSKRIGWCDDTLVKIRSDKQNICQIRFNNFSRQPKHPNGIVRKIDTIDYNKEVYDISTKDGTFVGGTGNVIYHNTDGIHFIVPEKYRGNQTTEMEFINMISDHMNKDIEIGMDGRYQSMLVVDGKSYATKDYEGNYTIKGDTLKSRRKEHFILEHIDTCVKAILDGNLTIMEQSFYYWKNRIESGQIKQHEVIQYQELKEPLETYKTKVELGAGNGGRNPDAAYEIACQKVANGFDIKVGDRIEYYVAASPMTAVIDGRNGQMKFKEKYKKVYQLAKDIDEFEAGNIHIDHYMKRLRKSSAPLFMLFYSQKALKEKFGISLYKKRRDKMQEISDKIYNEFIQ